MLVTNILLAMSLQAPMSALNNAEVPQVKQYMMGKAIEMPKLPYAPNALEPVISEQTIIFHYDKHLQGYVNTINKLIKGTDFEGKSIEELVKSVPEGVMYNNAGQTLNHILYFTQFQAPMMDNMPSSKLAKLIDKNFGSFEAFKLQFTKAASTIFGSGWAWLSQDKDGKLVITQEANGGNPLRKGLNPILGIDVWEHAYYLDYQNKRTDHLSAIWQIINWNTAEARLK